MVGGRIDVECANIGKIVSERGQCGGVACQRCRVTGDVYDASRAGFGDLPAYLRTCAGTRRIKHHDIGFGQIVAYVGKRLGHIAHTGVDIAQMDGPQIALRVFDSGLATFHAQHARAAGA